MLWKILDEKLLEVFFRVASSTALCVNCSKPTTSMKLITCGCLNVKIHIKNNDLKPVDLATVEGVDKRREFFTQLISYAHLNLEGIIVEHSSLLKKHQCGLWSLQKCINCSQWTHAVKSAPGGSAILVSMNLRTESTEIASLERSPDFSPLYKIVLRDKNGNQPINALGVQSEKYDSLQQSLNQIQQQLNKFLQERENSMEERIREFEESERSQFAALQKKARLDKNSLMRMILSAEETEDSTDGVLPLEAQHPPNQRGIRQDSRSFEASIIKPTSVNQSDTNTSSSNRSSSLVGGKQPSSKSASLLTSRLGHTHISSTEPEAQLFDADPTFDDDETSRPFYHSDDEENESTDDSELDCPANHPAMYSTSVPISVPAWKMPRKSQREEQYEDEVATDPDNIAASIKALARSVHGDGSEIFGDLPQGPRPRHNNPGYM